MARPAGVVVSIASVSEWNFTPRGGAQIVAFGFGGIAGDIPVVGKR